MTGNDKNISKSKLYAGIIWILSALALAIYGVMMFLNTNVPGIKELIEFLSSIDKQYIYLAAFISIFIEGLYFIGSFFPGAGLVLILTILSQTSGLMVFLITMSLIFIGWSLAGVANIYLAKVYRKKIIKLEVIEDYHVKDHLWATWFPSFRASHEVAQITEGANPYKVFISGLRVRLLATLFLGLIAFVIPSFFNIQNTTNREGYASIIVVVLISLVVGINKIRRYYLEIAK